jgi:uncharacterized DUF497 family protein
MTGVSRKKLPSVVITENFWMNLLAEPMKTTIRSLQGAVVEDDEHSSMDEDRYYGYGIVGDMVIMVSYTERSPRTRIISARPAEGWEEDKYYGNIRNLNA